MRQSTPVKLVQKTRSAKLHVAVYVFFSRTVDPCRRIVHATGRYIDDTYLEQRKEKLYVREMLGGNVRAEFRWIIRFYADTLERE